MRGDHYHFTPGNRVELLETGSEYFPALCRAIDAARLEVHLESYIFEDDETGHRVADALSRAARRGVKVHVLVDGFGASRFPRTLAPGLIGAGVEVRVFRPHISPFTLRRHRLRRLHRKVVIVDGALAFVGGINIIDDIPNPGQTPPRYDYAVAVCGPMVGDVLHSCRRLWALVNWASLRRRQRMPVPVLADIRPVGDMEARYVVRDNIRHRRDIEEAYLEAIASAREEIILANAYFLPGLRFRHAVLAAAARGVKVTLLLQGRVEYLLLHFATRALYGHFLASGVRIFEYHRSFLHAKVAVVDGRWATVGSSNIDPFSLLLAREANVVVRDAAFAGRLRASLRRAMETGARELKPEDWEHRPWHRRAFTWLAYGLVRLMIGLAGQGGRN
ncbi:MAG: cardiolipin synthase ClsB [Rhodocyclaceae bacterium]|nr:cardiolipin synthase ClsB [Rhodocyclaceae bacterium]